MIQFNYKEVTRNEGSWKVSLAPSYLQKKNNEGELQGHVYDKIILQLISLIPVGRPWAK